MIEWLVEDLGVNYAIIGDWVFAVVIAVVVILVLLVLRKEEERLGMDD